MPLFSSAVAENSGGIDKYIELWYIGIKGPRFDHIVCRQGNRRDL